ncbi:MAG: hypothetical protein ACTSYS_04150 [Promethearchaeota archaeon]
MLGSALTCLINAIMLLFFLYDTTIAGGPVIHVIISATCAMSIGLGFILVVIGSTSKKELSETIKEIDESNEKTLVDDEYRIELKEEPGAGRRLKGVMIVFLGGIVSFIFISIIYRSTSSIFRSSIVMVLFFSVALVGILLSRSAGFVNVDVYEMHVFGLHVHETVLGLLLIFIGLVYLFLGNTIDLYLGLLLFFSGTFFIGRDWKDYAEGRILTRD